MSNHKPSSSSASTADSAATNAEVIAADPPPNLKKFGEGEDLYRLLVETVSDYAIFLLDTEGYIQTWNPGAQRFKGYTGQEAIGRHFSMFYTPEDIQRRHPEHELKVAIAEGRFEEEGWRVRKDGTRFWANVVITRLRDARGRHIGFAKVTRDLTQRRAATEELRRSEERFRLLVTAVKDYAIFMLDPQGCVATWNDGAEKLKGYLPVEIIGHHFSRFYPEEDLRSGKAAWELEEATLTGRFEDEGWRVRKDGTRFWASVVLTAVRNEEGKLVGFSKVTRDITDRRRLEEKLRRANEDLDRRVQERTLQLERAVQARDEFMSIVSHELRTPVTSLMLQIQTALRQLKRGDEAMFRERSVKFAQSAGRQLDRLAKLIDDMLEVARISMDRLTIDLQDIELGEVVRETLSRLEEQASAAGIEISYLQDGPVRVNGDRLRLEQVVTNLLTNSLKYGGGKPVTVILRQAANTAYLSVQDKGIGIAPEDQARIFERFERAVDADAVSGMGLGLFISGKIIAAHRGRLSVTSTPGEGSTFTITLPARPPV